MNKIKLLAENFFVYGIGGILGNIVSFIMLPIVAHMLPNSSYFGYNDLTNTILIISTNLALFGMYDSMFRLYFDKATMEGKKNVCSTSLFFVLFSSVVISFILFFLRNIIVDVVYKDNMCNVLVIITVATVLPYSITPIVSSPLRMQNKKKLFLFSNFFTLLLSYSFTIILLNSHMYLIALPLATLLSSIIVDIAFFFINAKWFSYKSFDFNTLKSLLKISIPIMPSFLVYWIFNSSDKLMISWYLNASEVGIYSVGSKLGHLSQLIYTAFSGGWFYFAFATMNDKNQVRNNTLVFEYLGYLSFIFSGLVCVFSSSIYKLLFPIEYYKGYIISPYLFLAPLLQMLYQVVSNQFLIIKNTLPSMIVLFFGAILNIALNIIFIPKYGIEGAAIATLIGYIFSLIFCIFILMKRKLVSISNSFKLLSFVTLLYFIVWRFFFHKTSIISIVIYIMYFVISVIIFNKRIKFLFTKIFSLNKL